MGDGSRQGQGDTGLHTIAAVTCDYTDTYRPTPKRRQNGELCTAAPWLTFFDSACVARPEDRPRRRAGARWGPPPHP
ncbi:hypothetical protein GCM10023324_22570 [Streptomyces youssoufiensis]